MKLLTKTFFLLTVTLIMLAGCKLATPTEEAIQPTQPTDLEDEAMIDTGEEPMKIITCDMLKSKERKESCHRALNEMAAEELYAEITSTFDLARCDKLGGNMTANCKSYIENTGIKGPISEAELETLLNAMNMTYPEVTGEEGEEPEGYYDLAKCAALTAPGLKEYCERQLNGRIEEGRMYEILEAGDVSKCDTLITEQLKIACKEEFGIFPEEELLE